jgi:hypothetical protein
MYNCKLNTIPLVQKKNFQLYKKLSALLKKIAKYQNTLAYPMLALKLDINKVNKKMHTKLCCWMFLQNDCNKNFLPTILLFTKLKKNIENLNQTLTHQLTYVEEFNSWRLSTKTIIGWLHVQPIKARWHRVKNHPTDCFRRELRSVSYIQQVLHLDREVCSVCHT